jgi:hypothetical protein
MSGVLWIGDNDSEITMIVSAGFIDDIFHEIQQKLGTNHPKIIAAIQEGYVESAYCNLAELDIPSFNQVVELLIPLHSNLMQQVGKGVYPGVRLESMSWLKAGLLGDSRTSNPRRDTIAVVIKGNEEVLVERWCFEFSLELIVSQQNKPLSSNELKLVYKFWSNYSDTYDISSIAQLIFQKIDSVKLAYISNQYMLATCQNFINELKGVWGRLMT